VRFSVQRWRLEKKDPSAAVSEPVKPITFWLSNEIPGEAPRTDRLGILEWNKAFEKAGFKDAIVVRQQPDDADFDLGETQYSSIRWMTTATPSFARSARRRSIRAPVKSSTRTSAGTPT